ncbi:DUF1801 domain-containing protein [Actibacterium sp. 188UL27-1]|uniref:DUF1801 domain-containing protein n=1 Tax=Actibacterium sp. 188UL27-1 TaxID=2786961 RepID=UPI00195B4178|nr:DUF1801 domain-containing protein [Actibacterium sp. 188UL27-1]MBM7066757.1 DUF1801 domain-containing protein [Actibacterium sp. 188UL27-1]
MTHVVQKAQTKAPAVDREVAGVLAGYPPLVAQRLMDIRELIFAVAAADPRIKTLTETLKWGQPAYVTEASKTGTTIRLSDDATRPSHCKMLVHCQTDLVGRYHARFPDAFAYEKNRAVLISVKTPLAEAELAACINMALIYHL